MKALILATSAILLYSLSITILFRLWRVRRRAAAMMRLFLISLPVFAAVVMSSPADLGFLPPSLIEPFWWVDLALAGILYAAAFMGGVLQLYNLADRGFSLRIIMDIDQSSGGRMRCETLYDRYSEGKGMPWMYDKRIEGMLANQLVEVSEGTIRNTAKGFRVARLFGWLRCFLSIDQRPSGGHSLPAAEVKRSAVEGKRRSRPLESASSH